MDVVQKWLNLFCRKEKARVMCFSSQREDFQIIGWYFWSQRDQKYQEASLVGLLEAGFTPQEAHEFISSFDIYLLPFDAFDPEGVKWAQKQMKDYL